MPFHRGESETQIEDAVCNFEGCIACPHPQIQLFGAHIHTFTTNTQEIQCSVVPFLSFGPGCIKQMWKQ
jgi:hypothetical protein